MITIIVLWILLGIIAVIVILLHFSITAQIDLNKKGFDLRVRYMFFDIYPRKPKKKKQKRSKKAELPEDSFDDFEEFEDNIEESLPIPQTDDTPDKTGEVSEQIVEAKPEKIEKNEADENVSVAEVEDKQKVISDIDTDTNVEAGAEDKPEKITVKQEKKGFAGLFHKQKDKLELMRAQYGKAETSVNRIVSELEKHQVTLMKDIAMLDQMYELNLKYYKELTMYIIAGKKRLAEVRSGELEELRKKAEASGLAEDAQAYNDYAQKCERFEKKLHDLELTRMVSLQMGPQTRLLQNNDTLMVEKIQSSLVNTIPLWKSQMVLALGMEHSRQATAAQSAVAQTTNELLKKNADMLKMGTIATAKEAERSIVDIETLQHTNEQLVSTLDEVVNIQREGAQKRKEAEVELGRIEGELKQKLMELRS